MPAGAGEAALGTPARLPRYARPLRADRRVLRASRRVAVVRAERGMRHPLPVPRLEIRRERRVPGGPLGAGGERLPQEDQAEILQAGRARWRAVDLYGAEGARAAAARIRVRHRPPGAELHLQAVAGVQLAAGDG